MNERARELPSIPRAAARAWGDTMRAFGALPVPALIALIVVVALTIGQELASPPLRSQGAAVAPWLVLAVVMVLQAILIAPYLLALHRFIARGERTLGYALNPAAARFRRYVGWLVAVSVLVWLPFGLPALMTANLDRAIALFVIIVAIVVLVVLRLVLVFPALALDAPNAGAATAWADSAGRTWRMFFIFLLALLPWAALFVGVLAIEVAIAGAAVARPPVGWASVSALAQAAIVVIGHTLVFAAATRLYAATGDKPAPPPPAAPVKDKRDRPRDAPRRKRQ